MRSAFAWLLSLLCTAIIWNMVVPLKVALHRERIHVTPLQNEAWWSVFLAVPFQELFRFLFWKLLKSRRAKPLAG